MPIIDFDSDCWADPWFQGLEPIPKLLFIYLWTNDHRNIAGLYTISEKTIAFETGIEQTKIGDLLRGLFPKVQYDFDNSICWVVKHARRQFLRSNNIAPKQRMGIRRYALKLKWHPFFLDFVRVYPEIFPPEELEDFLKSSFKNEDDFSLTRRQIIWIRDNGKCQYCKKEVINDNDLEIDHIIPISRNGLDRYDNLVLACKSCNQKKYDRSPEEAGLFHPKAYFFNKFESIQKLIDSEFLKKQFIVIFGEETLSKGLKGFERVSNSWGKGGGKGKDLEKGGVGEKTSFQQLFGKFWSGYPKKRNKGEAEKAFKKVSPDEQLVDRMLTAIERAKKSAEWLKENGQFIPYPATWLNAKGWEDEFEVKTFSERKWVDPCPNCDLFKENKCTIGQKPSKTSIPPCPFKVIHRGKNEPIS